MKVGKAMAIVKQIERDKYTDIEKAHAIYLVMNMPTHMSITKDELIKVIKWLWHHSWEYKEETESDAE